MTFDQIIARWDSARLTRMADLAPGDSVVFRPRGEAQTVESATLEGERVVVKWAGCGMTDRFPAGRVVRVAV